MVCFVRWLRLFFSFIIIIIIIIIIMPSFVDGKVSCEICTPFAPMHFPTIHMSCQFDT